VLAKKLVAVALSVVFALAAAEAAPLEARRAHHG
jgi:hypothetical protein